MKKQVIISNHAKKRLSKRLSLPRKAQQRHANKAFYDGEIVSPLKSGQQMLILYRDFFYIFSLSDEGLPLLVTAYPNQTKRKKNK